MIRTNIESRKGLNFDKTFIGITFLKRNINKPKLNKRKLRRTICISYFNTDFANHTLSYR